MLSLTPTAANRATLVRLRTAQRRINANLNVIALHLSNTRNLQPTADQWAGLWDDLDAANATLQRLSEKLTAEINRIEQQQLEVRGFDPGTEEAL